MEHLFKAWRDFSAACRAAAHIVLLADYDGTLANIVGRPQDAVLSPGVRKALSLLARKPTFSVGVVSGRQLAELKSLVAIEGIYYAGNHGLEIEGIGLNYFNAEAEAVRPVIAGLARKLAAALKGINGVIIQEKGLSLSVHYRLAKPEYEDAVTGIVRRITARYEDEGKIRVFAMKKVREIRPPVDWDKGKALETIENAVKKRVKKKELLTIYLGDDTTDEDAFRILRHPVGWGIYVGEENPASAAEYFLNSPAEVEEFLIRLNELK
jgi:trehalose-phosphatase